MTSPRGSVSEMSLPGIQLPGDAEEDIDNAQPVPRPLRGSYRDGVVGKPGTTALDCSPGQQSPAGGLEIRRLSDAEQSAALRLSGKRATIRDEQPTSPPPAPEEPEVVIAAPDPGELKGAEEAFSGASGEAARIAGIVHEHEASIEGLHKNLAKLQEQNAAANAEALLGNKKAKPATDTTKAEKELAEAEHTLKILRTRWSAAALVSRQCRKALLGLQARAKAAERQSLIKHAGELEAEARGLRADATEADLEAGRLRNEVSNIITQAVVLTLRGNPQHIRELANDPLTVVDLAALDKLLGPWENGFAVSDGKMIVRTVRVSEGVVYLAAASGAVLGNDIFVTCGLHGDPVQDGFSNNAGKTLSLWRAPEAVAERVLFFERGLKREEATK